MKSQNRTGNLAREQWAEPNITLIRYRLKGALSLAPYPCREARQAARHTPRRWLCGMSKGGHMFTVCVSGCGVKHWLPMVSFFSPRVYTSKSQGEECYHILHWSHELLEAPKQDTKPTSKPHCTHTLPHSLSGFSSSLFT